MATRNGKANSGLIRSFSCLFILVFCYLLLIGPFTGYMHSKPIVEKLGHFPRIEVLQFISADQKQMLAASMVMKVMMYFGGLMADDFNRYKVPPDYPAMSRVIHGAVKLDPYNMDAYYFAQGLLVWDIHAYKIANDLLDYGMKYRIWDWYLPYFAGFNSAYFLKDYQTAARYYKKAADLSGDALSAALAGRYMQKTGQTELALSYLAAMEKSTRNVMVKKYYATRMRAFKAVRVIEIARDTFQKDYGRLPNTFEELVRSGYLQKVPLDPYGGKFYFEKDGTVSSTSDFTFVKGSGISKEKDDK